MTYDELKTLIETRGVHPALGPTGEGYNIEQNPHELAVFLEDMIARGVHKVLEIGSGYRMGLSRFLVNDLGWQVVSIDREQPQFAAPGVQFLMGSSEILRPLFEGAQFDLVIIDGDNSYEGVTQDYINYAPLVTIALAVCKIGGLRGCEGVRDKWSEITGRGAHTVFDADPDRHSGIGWIIVDEVQALKLPEQENPPYYEDSPAWKDDLDDFIHEPVIIEEDELPKPIKPRKPRKKKSA